MADIKQKEGKKDPITKETFRVLGGHLKPYRRDIYLVSVLGVLSAIANGFVPYVSGKFIDSLVALGDGAIDGTRMPLWLSLLLIWAGIQLLANHFDWFIERIYRKTGIKLHLDIQARGFSHLLILPMSFYKSMRIGEAIETINKASWRTSSVLRTITSVAPQLLGVFIGIVLAATINPMMAGVLILGVLLYVLLLTRILRKSAELDDKAHSKWNGVWNDAEAVVRQVDSVKQSATEEEEIERIHTGFMQSVYKPWEKLQMIWSNVAYFQRLIVFFTQLTVFVLSVQLIKAGMLTVGELIALNGYAVMFFGPFVQLGHSWQIIQNGLISASHAHEKVFSKEPEVYHPKNAAPLELLGSVVFDRVSYAYDKGKTVLDDVSFKVNPGQVVAFVGPSGVGKSTAISLISGYHFPTEGSVVIDDTETNKLDLTELRKQIAVVPQEVALFNESIEHNIKYGTSAATREEVREAAKKAHIHEFVEGLTHGYETLVGERGVRLSVGQKQRVAIARAILRNPQILILDEPTSALDAETEELMTQSLRELMQGRTTFIIAHRLSTIRHADKIFVFKEGRIVESGTHHELLKKEGGEYRNLHELQIGLRE